jgi:hypothetical protein
MLFISQQLYVVAMRERCIVVHRVRQRDAAGDDQSAGILCRNCRNDTVARRYASLRVASVRHHGRTFYRILLHGKRGASHL